MYNGKQFYAPTLMTIDKNANLLYVPDSANDTIRTVSTLTGDVTTIAGVALVPGGTDTKDGTPLFNEPNGVAVDTSGNVYVADLGDFTVRKITPAGVVSTIAGTSGQKAEMDGLGTAARFLGPSGIVVDASSNFYVSDYTDRTIRKITPDGTVSTLAGAPAAGNTDCGTVQFAGPNGMALDAEGNLIVADPGNNMIYKITLPTCAVTPVAGAAGPPGSTDSE